MPAARHAFRRRFLILGAIIILAALVAASDALHGRSEEILALAESVIARHPSLGMALFVLLGMVSAMLAFFSSALLVPVGVYTWGATGCLVLLWLGWLLGGITAFAIGKVLGRSVAMRLVGEARYGRFEQRFSSRLRFGHVLFFQLTLPSEIPGYVLGALRYRFWPYLLALALAELPYAAATVFLGAMYLQRHSALLMLLGLATVAAGLLAYRMYRSARVR